MSGQHSGEGISGSCRLMSRREAAEYLGIAEQTLAIWKCTERYYLPVVKIGRLAKYRKVDLDAFISVHTVKRRSDAQVEKNG